MAKVKFRGFKSMSKETLVEYAKNSQKCQTISVKATLSLVRYIKVLEKALAKYEKT